MDNNNSVNQDTKVGNSDSNILYCRLADGWFPDEINGAASDSSGNIYLTGSSNSEVFMGAIKPENGSAYAVKLSHCGEVVYSLFIIGSDNGITIAVDSNCNAYVVGSTTYSDLPVTPGAYQSTYLGKECGFIVKLNPAGNQILYASYFGSASGTVTPTSMAMDQNGNLLITGFTDAPDFPVADLWPDGRGSTNAFVLKFELAGNQSADLIYGYAIGGNSPSDSVTKGWSIKAEDDGTNYLVGETKASNFHTTPGAIRSVFQGESEGFLIKLSPAGNLLYSTYIGGSLSDRITDIAMGTAGALYITGDTDSPNLATPGAFLTSVTGTAAFASRLDIQGSLYTVSYFTYLGAGPTMKLIQHAPQIDVYEMKTVIPNNNEYKSTHIAVDQSGCAYVSGTTSSEFYGVPFPITPDAFQSDSHAVDGYITKFSTDGRSVLFSSYLGFIPQLINEESYTVTTIDPDSPLRLIFTHYSDYYYASQNVTALAVDDSGSVFLAGSLGQNDNPLDYPMVIEGFCRTGIGSSGYVIKLGETPCKWPEASRLTVDMLDSHTLRLHWTAAMNGVTQYRIYREGDVLTAVDGDTLTYTVTNAPSASRYFYKIEAGNADGSFSSDGPLCFSDYPLGFASCFGFAYYIVFNTETMKRICPLYIRQGFDELITPDHKTAIIISRYPNCHLKLIDLSTLKTVSETPLGDNISGGSIGGITPDGRFAVLNLEGSNPEVTSILSFDVINQTIKCKIEVSGTALAVSPNGSNLVFVRLANETGLRIYSIDASGQLSSTEKKVDFLFSATSLRFSKGGMYAFGLCNYKIDNHYKFKLFSLRIKNFDDITVTLSPDYEDHGSLMIKSDGSMVFVYTQLALMLFTFDFFTETLSLLSSFPMPFWPGSLLIDDANYLLELNCEENRLYVSYFDCPQHVIGSGVNNIRIFREDWTAIGEIPDSLDPKDIIIRPAFQADQQAPVWPAGSSLTASDITSRSLTLHWTPAVDSDGVTAYSIYLDGMHISEVAGDVTDVSVAGLTPDTLYQFKVEAGNAAGLWTFYGPSAKERTLKESPKVVMTSVQVCIIRIA